MTRSVRRRWLWAVLSAVGIVGGAAALTAVAVGHSTDAKICTELATGTTP